MKKFSRLFCIVVTLFVLNTALNASIVVLDKSVFNSIDATTHVQKAFDSSADTVLIRNVGEPWIVRPLFIRRNNLTLILEPGVVLLAKSGAYPDLNDDLIDVTNGVASTVKNLKIIGYGAKLKMLKDEYEKSQWRHCLHLRWVENVEVFGLTCEDSGGDGFMVDRNHFGDPSINVHLKDCLADNNSRQGISVISVDGLLIENCIFKNTKGHWPMAGIDIEPDKVGYMIKNVLVRKCQFIGNEHSGIEIALHDLDSTDVPVSIRFEDCYVSSRRALHLVSQPGLKGFVEFERCFFEDSKESGMEVSLPAYNNYSPPGIDNPNKVFVRFNQCVWKNVGNWMPSPFWFRSDAFGNNKLPQYEFGGIEFVDCVLHETRDRPVILTENSNTSKGIANVRGSLTIINENKPYMELGSKAHDMDSLQIRHLRNVIPTTVNIYSDQPVAIETTEQPALFGVERSSNDLSTPVPVTYSLRGDPVSSQDYTMLNGMLMIAKGESMVQDTLYPLQDVLAEGIETMAIDVKASTLFTKGADKSVSLEIWDDITSNVGAIKKSSLLIYPNPAISFVTIGRFAPGSTVTIYNMQGKLLFQEVCDSDILTLDTGRFPVGICLIRVGNQLGKIMVHK
jgi:hypothetical protein